MRITEYVGKEGVVSSEATHSRLSRPRSGDVVEWQDGQHGRIWEVGTGYCEPGEVHVCSGMGSAFLTKGGVDISGGPFFVLALGDLEPQLRLYGTTVWNWGDNLPGAGKGVEYSIARPVFAYVGDRDIYTHRVDAQVSS